MRRFLTTILLFISITNLFAQTVDISGVVDDRDTNQSNMGKVNITLPGESFAFLESRDNEDGSLALMVINSALKDFKDDVLLKKVFGWYCSVVFDYYDVDDSLWPSSEELSFMQQYVDEFDRAIKGDPDHPNALFVAKITHNGTCQVIWMLNNPNLASDYLDGVIAENNQKREFDYRIEQDRNWDSIGYFLQDFPSSED